MEILSKEDLFEKAKELTRQYRSYWDEKYNSHIKDYRLLSEGKLPTDMENELSKLKYKYDSILVPRMILNANNNLKAMILNAIFNRNETFEFIGRTNKEDHEKAKFANQLVDDYAFEVTGVEETVNKMIEDCLETGICYGEVEYRKIYEDVMRQQVGSPGSERLKKLFDFFSGAREAEVVYDGAILKHIDTEMLAPEPVRKPENISAYSRYAVVSISDLLERAERKNQSYYQERKNLEKIKPADFEDFERQWDTSSDHTEDSNNFDAPDFKVLLNVFWMKTKSFLSKDKPRPHRIAIANNNTNPQLLEIAVDPMKNGKMPLVAGRIFPRNKRLMGFAAPELLFDLFMEKFAKRNQRINYMNQAIELAGMLVIPQGAIVDRKSILVKRGKIVEISGTISGASDIKTIDMPMQPMAMSIQEESVIDIDVDETLQSNKVSRGNMPSRQEKATTVAIVDENSKILQSMPVKNVENSIIKPVARLYLDIFQNFAEDKFIIRILGKDGYEFKNMFRKDFMGYYDVKCHASSEILPKALKQAAYAQMAQVYGANPRCNIDIDKLCMLHGEALEIPMGELINDRAKDMAEIEREETIMLTFGRPTPPLEHEPHIYHITHHMESMQQLMMQGQQNSDAFRALEMHKAMHEQMMAELQGQINVPTQANPHNLGEAINNTSAESAVKTAGF